MSEARKTNTNTKRKRVSAICAADGKTHSLARRACMEPEINGVMPLKMSIVIPVNNEQQSLPLLVAELIDVAERQQLDIEVTCVDDGSTDDTWQKIQELHRRFPQVRGIRLRRHLGKSAALSAGFAAAHTPLVVTMDGDQQDNPEDLPKFLAKLDQGYDLVNGWKRNRRDRWTRVVASRLFNWAVRTMTRVPLHDHNCGFKLIRREVLELIPLYGDRHRFIPVLAAALGFRVGEVEVNHRPRVAGRSKYGIGRVPKGLLDLMTVTFVTSFGQRPQHLLGGLGLASMGLGGLIWLVSLAWYARAQGPAVDPGTCGWGIYTSLLGGFLVLLGVQLLLAGLLAEWMLVRTMSGRQSQDAAIAEFVGFNPDKHGP